MKFLLGITTIELESCIKYWEEQKHGTKEILNFMSQIHMVSEWCIIFLHPVEANMVHSTIKIVADAFYENQKQERKDRKNKKKFKKSITS